MGKEIQRQFKGQYACLVQTWRLKQHTTSWMVHQKDLPRRCRELAEKTQHMSVRFDG